MLNADNRLLADSEEIRLDQLPSKISTFILNPQKLPNLPSNPRKAVVSLQTDRGTSYEAYIELYDVVRATYSSMRNDRSLEEFGRAFEYLPHAQQLQIRDEIPLIISEAEPTSYGELID